MRAEKITTICNKSGEKFDFYVLTEQGKQFYNLVPAGALVPDGGYYEVGYIFKIKGF